MNVKYGAALLTVMLAACNTQQTSQAQSGVTDAYLTTAVAGKLAAIDTDATTAVKVSTSNAVVTLNGEARSPQELDQYLAAARSVSGVKSVVNDLRVSRQVHGLRQSAADAALTVRVEAAIAGQAGANVFHVAPSVRDGVVTLKGSVPNTLVKATIVKTVSGVSGVKRVVNDVSVSP
jgi:hyperosmotically inducible protein